MCFSLNSDRKAWAIFVFGLMLCLLHILSTAPEQFAIDFDIHTAYIEFVAIEHRAPRTGEVIAAYHLPTYYIANAIFYSVGQGLGVEPFQMARFFSLLCYAAYLLIAIKFLQRFVPQTNATFYMLLLVLACWPVGIVNSGRLHPEILAYVGHMGFLLSIVCWMADKKNTSMANAFAFCGLFLLARNFATFFLGLLIILFIYTLYVNRQRLMAVLTPRMCLSIGFCVLCYISSSIHTNLAPTTTPTVPRPPFDWGAFFYTFAYFNPLLFVTETALDPHIGQSLDHHWHYFLRSALLGQFTDYKAWAIVFAANTVWFFIMIYTLWGFLVYTYRRLSAEEKRAYGLMMFLIAMMCGMAMGARFFHPHMPDISDARYVFPMTALFLACYGRTIMCYQTNGRATMASIGRGLAIGMIGLSVTLFAAEHLIL